MAYTNDQLIALEAALARGESSVSFGDRTVNYRSIAELITAINVIKKSMAQTDLLENKIYPIRQIQINSYKGF